MHSLVHVCTILKNFGQRPFMEGLHVYMYMYMLCVSQNGCEKFSIIWYTPLPLYPILHVNVQYMCMSYVSWPSFL